MPLSRKKKEMPRERVQHGKQFLWLREIAPGETPHQPHASTPYLPGMEIPEGGVIHSEPSLDVRWNRDAGWVQMSIDAPRDWWERFIASYEGSPEAHEFSVHTEVLSRSEINNLISTLRRARDAAYGADQ